MSVTLADRVAEAQSLLSMVPESVEETPDAILKVYRDGNRPDPDGTVYAFGFEWNPDAEKAEEKWRRGVRGLVTFAESYGRRMKARAGSVRWLRNPTVEVEKAEDPTNTVFRMTMRIAA